MAKKEVVKTEVKLPHVGARVLYGKEMYDNQGRTKIIPHAAIITKVLEEDLEKRDSRVHLVYWEQMGEERSLTGEAGYDKNGKTTRIHGIKFSSTPQSNSWYWIPEEA